MKPITQKILTFTILSFVVTTVALAQGTSGLGPAGDNGIDVTDPGLGGGVGGGNRITTLSQIFIFLINLMRWLGWVGVILGVFIAIFALIYKLISTPSEKASEAVQGAVTKAVIIVIAGILLLSVGFFINQIGKLLGLTLNTSDVVNGQGGSGQNNNNNNNATKNCTLGDGTIITVPASQSCPL